MLFGESLVEQEFPIMDGLIYPTLESDINLYGFDGTYLVICGKKPIPDLYSTITHEIKPINPDIITNSQITAVKVFNSTAAVGYQDGIICVWKISPTKISLLQFSSFKGKPIIHIAYLGSDKHLLIGDSMGIISQLSMLNSGSCEMVIQTTIINMKCPISSLVQNDGNIIAFSSKNGLVCLKIGRTIDVLYFKPPNNSMSITCTDVFSKEIESSNDQDSNSKSPENEINKKITKNPPKITRAILCNENNLTLVDFDENYIMTRKIEDIVFEAPIVRCFVPDLDHIILVLASGVALLLNPQCEIIKRFDNLPLDVAIHNIFFFGHSLLMFGLTALYQKKLF